MGYTYNQNEVRGSDYYGVNYTGPKRPLISRVPKHLLKLWTSYQLPGGEWLHRLNVSAGVNAQTDSFNAGTACVQYVYGADVNGNPTASCAKTASYQYTVGAYAVFSARLAYQLGQHWSAALNVNNLTDRTYYQTVSGSDGGNWYGEPRSFMLSMRGSF
ncbi:MAG: TonB-dependent receptor [Gammaproteobacteria bacterium]